MIIIDNTDRRHKLVDAILQDADWSYTIVESFILDADISAIEQLERYLFDEREVQE
jgi:RecB family endonuclease NucS